MGTESVVHHTGGECPLPSLVGRFRMVLPASSLETSHQRAAGQGRCAQGGQPCSPQCTLPIPTVAEAARTLWREAEPHSSLSCKLMTLNRLLPGTVNTIPGALLRTPHSPCAEPAHTIQDLPSIVSILHSSCLSTVIY